MYRITTQLSEVFDCTVPELETKGILAKFKAWLKRHPELKVCHDIRHGEGINGDIADRFFAYYESRRAN